MEGKVLIDLFNNAVEHINQNSGFYSFLTTFIMVLVTAVYVWLTHQMLKENKKARKQQERPFVIVDFEVKNYLIYLKIKNAGNSPARNININFDIENNEDISNFPNYLEYLPPNRELLYTMHLVVENDPNVNDSQKFNIKVDYTDLKENKYSNEYKIDLITYIDMASHDKGEFKEIEKRLKKIEKALGGSRSIKSILKDISKKLK